MSIEKIRNELLRISNELDISYNPASDTVKTWWRRTYKVDFKHGKLVNSEVDNEERKIKLYFTNEPINEIGRTFVHEVGHAEMYPVRAGIMAGIGIYLGVNPVIRSDVPQIDLIFRILSAIGGITLYYVTLNEFLPDIYFSLKKLKSKQNLTTP
jgi:hypothetical protein